MAVRWISDITVDDHESVGGKGASLGELANAGLPVPSGFVVTSETYREFIESTGIDTDLFSAVDIDPDNSAALAAAEEQAKELILGTELPESVKSEILEAFGELGSDVFVAVRSSATAEDLPGASFAGQQETFLNVTRSELIDRIKECWASLFTQRAIYYRVEQGFDHESVNIAVVVQEMVDAEKSGVMFTSHPSSGDPEMVIEAAWGLGEGVVSGTVSPDNYTVSRRAGEITATTVAEKKTMFTKDTDTGETIEQPVSEDQRLVQVLSEKEILELVSVGEQIEDHYGSPQDVEWAIVDDEIFVLQSRPITTISSMTEQTKSGGTNTDSSADEAYNEIIVKGLGASPGKVSGEARVILALDELDKVSKGDIIVTEMTTPDMVPAMKRAAGLVTNEGGMTSHAAIVSRELGVPAVVGTQTATSTIADGQLVTIDGEQGTVTEGKVTVEEEHEPIEAARPKTPVKPMTATEVKVNVSIPEAAERAAATGADGVGLLRLEHLVMSTNKTPERFIANGETEAYIDEIVTGVRTVADAFYPRPVRVRTLDAPTDEFRQLEGGENEPVEHNPMLGFRGIRRSLEKPDVFKCELEAFNRLFEMGYDNIELMFPLVIDGKDTGRARSLMEDAGIDPEKQSWGVMIETPASALAIEDIIDAGIDFASFGTNDLTQYTLAVDRNNENVAELYDELHSSILKLISQVIEECREKDVRTSICGQAGSRPQMVRFLVKEGVSSISANIDAVRDVQHEVKRVEQQYILDTIRDNFK